MTDYEDDIDDRDLALALRRLAAGTVVPPADPRREAALMAAFDAAQVQRPAPRTARLAYWGMGGLATAAAMLIAVGLAPVRAGRHGTPNGGTMATHGPASSSSRDVPLDQPPAGEFVLVPGAASLPRMESGSLVRMDVPVSMLPALGITPPANRIANVRADVIVGQDGLARAVRLVD
jgi:hypothetical protein